MQCFETEAMLMYIKDILSEYDPVWEYDVIFASDILDAAGVGSFVELQKQDRGWIFSLSRPDADTISHAA